MRPDGRIEAGQPLATAISARAWNRAQEAADIVLGRQYGNAAGGPSTKSAPYSWVYAKNEGADAIERWQVMAIGGLLVTPSSSDAAEETKSFLAMPVVVVEEVDDETTATCIAVEPIQPGKVGMVAVAGSVQVRVDDLHKLATATVIWKNEDWALVVVGGCGVRLGTIDADWTKGSTAVVTALEGDGTEPSEEVTFDAKNYFSDIEVESGETKKVACILIDGVWALIAAECD